MKKALLCLVAMIFVSVSAMAAELPFSLSIDTTGGYNITDEAVYAENEIAAEKEFDSLKNFTFGLGNIVTYEDPDFSDEVYFTVAYTMFEVITVGVKPQLFFGEEFSSGVTGSLGLSHEIENMGLSFSLDNEFAYNFNESAFEYVNTLGMEKLLVSFGAWTLAAGIENELVVPDGDIEDALSVGPSISNDLLSFSAVYVIGLAPEVSHGVEIGMGLSF